MNKTEIALSMFQTGSKEEMYRLIREFVDTFRAMHGSLDCRELLGCDISTPDGYKTAADMGIPDTMPPVC